MGDGEGITYVLGDGEGVIDVMVDGESVTDVVGDREGLIPQLPPCYIVFKYYVLYGDTDIKYVGERQGLCIY